MSIAAIASSFVSAVRERAPLAPVEAVTAARGAAHAHRDGGRRHELVDAMQEVLGVAGGQDRSDEQAMFRFAHALMQDLRSMAAGGEQDGQRRPHEHGDGDDRHHGRGHGWGRRQWSDLPQRIDALATAAAATGTRAAAAPTEPVEPTPPTIPTAALTLAIAPDIAEVPTPEVPPPPNPVTATSAALHLMQVPSSRLFEAYAALRQALGDQTDAPAPETTGADLAAFLKRLSEALMPEAPSALPAGSVLNLSA